MLDLQDVNSSIKALENGDTTYENCEKLASLYIIRQYFNKPLKSNGNAMENEYKDILPQYHKYIELKRRYQLGEVNEKAVENSIKKVCTEIVEFLRTFYQCIDTPQERLIITKMLAEIQRII